MKSLIFFMVILTTHVRAEVYVSNIEHRISLGQRNMKPGETTLEEVADFIGVSKLRKKFELEGKNTAVVILDTGINPKHKDFEGGRVYFYENFTDEPSAIDYHGHGTHIAGIIGANGIHKGIAPLTKIISLKVLKNNGKGNIKSIIKAFDWILENEKNLSVTICAVNLSLSDGNFHTELPEEKDILREKIKALRKLNIPVICSSGNEYGNTKDMPYPFGLSYPAIIPETISVGAIFNKNIGPVMFSNCFSYITGPHVIAPFSQRLPAGKNFGYNIKKEYALDTHAPGIRIVSSGIILKNSETVGSGTSQAAAVTTGAILLIQDLYLSRYGKRAPMRIIESYIKNPRLYDGDDELDFLAHSFKKFGYVDLSRFVKNH